jgi:CheY-like chemotaxis protein
MKLIAITGWGRDSDRRRTLGAGFDHHLTKPIDPSRLEQLLDSTSSSPAAAKIEERTGNVAATSPAPL